MSIDALSWAFRVEGVKDAYEAAVLLALADFADAYGVAYPAVSTLAARSRCSVRKVRYCLVALEDKGLILGISRRRPNGSQRSTAFVLVGFPGRKVPARADEHPVLEQLHLEGRLPPETIRVHDVPPADPAAQSAQDAGGQTARQVAADCTPCSSGLHDRSQQTAQRAALEPSLEPSLEPPLQPARASERPKRPVRRSADATGAALLEGAASSSEIAAWLEHRRALDMPEISAKAARVLAGELREIRARGVDPDAALRLARSRGWRTVRADWLGGSVS